MNSQPNGSADDEFPIDVEGSIASVVCGCGPTKIGFSGTIPVWFGRAGMTGLGSGKAAGGDVGFGCTVGSGLDGSVAPKDASGGAGTH